MSRTSQQPSPVALARRIIGHPPAMIPLTVFLLVAAACWLIPTVWPYESSETRLSLGASAPWETIFSLEPLQEGAEARLVSGDRAQRLAESGQKALAAPVELDWVAGESFGWVEIPPIVRTVDGSPVPPAWIPEARLDDYFNGIADKLPGGVSDLPGDPLDFTTLYSAQKSSLLFPAGTDELGRDLFVRILEGGRISIAVGLAATLVSVTIGILYGGIAGYVGGKTDEFMMRFVDILYALPFLLFVILLMVVFERSLLLLFVAIGAVEWLTTARIVRGEVLALKKLPFVDAARCLGLRHSTILGRHILPNTMAPVIVYATLTIPTVILLESVLSFLGLGVQPPASSWGILLNEGAERLQTYPWMLIYPSILFALTLLCLNRLGDSLRDLLDPKGTR